ncbi:unnamed protein product [Symbiodinium sp. CCMP2592]|nr:unnamed protein product [Symbiodinium sp. CCMP2592]
MAGWGSNGLPSVLHRSAPATAAHPLNGDVLKAFDKYNTGLQEAAAAACGLSELCECKCGLIKFVLRCYVPPKGNASGAGRGKAPKKRAGAKSVASATTTKTRASLLNEVFKTDEDKHQRWGQELKKEINGLSNLMLDLGDSTKETEMKSTLVP